MRFKIDWASPIVGGKFAVFALFYFVFAGNFPSTNPPGAYIWRGLYMEGLIFGILRYYVVNASPLALIKHNSPVFLGVTIIIQVPEGKGCKE